MKKKNLLRGLIVSYLLLCSAHMWAYDFTAENDEGVIIYCNIISFDNRTCEVTYKDTKYNSYSGCVSIPSSLKFNGTTYVVISIGQYAFYGCLSLTEVAIGSSVTSIGGSAFYGCSSLTEVTIGESVTSIGQYAFYECSSLKEVTIPNSVTSIGQYAFYGCSSLTEVAIGSSVRSIGDYAFYNCSDLMGVTIPNSITNIGGSAFYNCSSLKVVTIGSSVTSIGWGAFYGCSSLTEVTIGYSVTNIEGSAFRDCSSLMEVTSLNPEPPMCESDTFGSSTSTCLLYVPLGTTKAYSEATGWKDFFNIEEIDTSGIKALTLEEVEIVGYYSINGKEVNAPQKGINIVRYSDGTTRKVLVQ